MMDFTGLANTFAAFATVITAATSMIAAAASIYAVATTKRTNERVNRTSEQVTELKINVDGKMEKLMASIAAERFSAGILQERDASKVDAKSLVQAAADAAADVLDTAKVAANAFIAGVKHEQSGTSAQDAVFVVDPAALTQAGVTKAVSAAAAAEVLKSAIAKPTEDKSSKE